MAEKGIFEKIGTFHQWDDDYYHPIAMKFYDQAVQHALDCLEAGPGDLVLDAGCGPGEHSIRMARSGCRVHAIDISTSVLEEASRRVAAAGFSGSVTFEQADLTALHFQDASFDRIFSWGVAIHIPQVEKAFAELSRILRPGGRLALFVTNARACDYTLLGIARAVMRRPGPELLNQSLGRGCWYGSEPSRLWVWRFNLHALTDYLGSLGLRRTHRIAGSLTELHVRVKGIGRNLLLRANNAWYGLGLPAWPCVTNLLIFEKSAIPADKRKATPCAWRT